MYDPFREIDFERSEELEKLDNLERRLSEMEEDKEFTLKIDKILCILFQGNDLVSAKLYESVIIDFIKNNVRKDVIDNPSLLMNVVKTYFEVLTNKNVTIDKLLYLNNYLSNKNNIIRSEIERIYLNSKYTLISARDLLGINVDEYSDTDTIIKTMLEMYQDQSTRNRVFGKMYSQNANQDNIVITRRLGDMMKAFDTILLIRSNSTIAMEIEAREKKALVYHGRR